MAKNVGTANLTATQAFIIASVNVLFAVIGVFGNALVFVIVARNRRLHTVSNLFIISLALADLLACIIAQPMYAAFLFGLLHNPIYRDVRKTFSFVSLLASISSLVAITVERYTAIVWPMMYQRRANLTNVLVLLFIVWSLSIGMGIPAGIGQVPWFPNIVVYYTMSLVLIVSPINLYIYIIARRQARAIAKQVGHLGKSSQGKNERENIAAKTIGSVLAVFAICWVPVIVTPMIYRYGNRGKLNLAFKWVQTLALCSSAVNPVIYCLKTQIFRKELKDICRRVFRGSSSRDKPEFI